MSRDLNSQIASYANANNITNSATDKKKVVDDLKSISTEMGDNWQNTNSLFEFKNDDDTISQEEFLKIIENATGSSSMTYEASLLFNVLNTDVNEDGQVKDLVLTKDEVRELLQDNKEISAFSLWDAIGSFDEESVNYEISYKADLEALKNNEISVELLTAIKGKTYVDKLLEEASEEGITSVSSETLDQIADFILAKGNNSKEGVSDYLKNSNYFKNILTDEQYSALENKLTELLNGLSQDEEIDGVE